MNQRDMIYSEVSPLLQSDQLSQTRLECVFACPVSGLQAKASADVLTANAGSLRTKAKTRLRAGLLQSVTRTVGRTLRSVLGNNAFSRLAGDVACEAAHKVGSKGAFNQVEREAAVVAAFAQVRAQFGWQDESARYVHRSILSAGHAQGTVASGGKQVGAALPLLLVCSVAAGMAGELAAQQTVVFTVGGNREAGKRVASEGGGKWAKNPSKAFKQAAKRMASGEELEVIIRFAAGEFDGDLGSGAFTLPSFRNKDCVLRWEGGYSRDFATRDPFGTPTRLCANEGRSAPLLKFRNSSPRDQDEVKALILDGLQLDVAGSNKYDPKSNSLLKSASCTQVMIHFGYLRTDLLEIRNCMVLNSPHRAFETLIRPASSNCEVRLVNNLFWNCVIPVKLDTARYRHKPARILVDHCSFLTNWAFSPDPNTSNPAALEFGPKDAAHAIHITNNLFYANFGGAILALHKQLPPLTITENNFVGNGLLHGQAAEDAVAMIVEASGRKQPIDVETIEDLDAVEEVDGNVSLAPGIGLSVAGATSVDASKLGAIEGWNNEVRRLLGKPLQGGRVEVSNYAPRVRFEPSKQPLPTVPAARAYGYSPERARRGA